MTVEQPSIEQRGEEILNVFGTAFSELLAADPTAFQAKFRKMAASAFAFYSGNACFFYSGNACFFYHDLQQKQHGGPYLNDQTSRIWIHGDLHAENFGTYMNSQGRLIFNRFAASIALVGYATALSDKQIAKFVQTYAAAYRGRIHTLATSTGQKEVSRFTLETAKGPLLEALHSARAQNRIRLLDSMTEIHDLERRFTLGGGAVDLDSATREKVAPAFHRYLETLPKSNKGRSDSAYRIKDVVVSASAAQASHRTTSYLKATAKPWRTTCTASDYFHHEGHRTVISQRALQAYSDEWLGGTEIDGAGQLVAEVSPYAVDLDWSDINDPEQIALQVADLGRVTAMMHGAGDDGRSHWELVPFSPEKAIHAAIATNEDQLADLLVGFVHKYSAQARRDHHIFVDLFPNGCIPGLSANVDSD